MSARVLQNIQMSILGGIIARILVPRTPVLVRVLQTLQMSIRSGIKARSPVPIAPALARVLQTFQMSIRARIATILAAIRSFLVVLFAPFASFSRRSLHLVVLGGAQIFSTRRRAVVLVLRPRRPRVASRHALSRRPFPVARGRSESSSRASRSDARVSSRSDATPRRSRRRRSATLSNARPRRAGGFRRDGVVQIVREIV